MAAEGKNTGRTVYVVDEAFLEELRAFMKALRPLMNLESTTLDIKQGDRKTVINIKGAGGGYREQQVTLCDSAGNSQTVTILVR